MIPSELGLLLAPLEDFETLRRHVVRRGRPLCDLSYANPYEKVEQTTRETLRRALDDERTLSLQYTPFGGNTLVRRAVADGLAVSHGAPFTYEDVVLTPGATAALHAALRVASAPGDEVVMPVPCWLDYPVYAAYLGLRPVLVPLAKGSFDLDIDRIAGALGPRTCAILLSHPANPTGRSYDVHALKSLAATLEDAEERFGRTILWIADETHRDFAPSGSFCSAASFWPATLLVYSFGKYHFLQGQRAGYAAVSPKHPQRGDVAQELLRWMRVMGFGAPNTLMQQALPALQLLRHDLTRLDRWRVRFVSELCAAGYEVVPPVTTFFVYVATPGTRDDSAFTRSVAEAGVLVLPAPVFHHKGYFRLALTGSDDMLERALSTLCRFG